ncbi:myo-inosose-2 dehydratase [Alicyclobacillus macrosporangiidus]|uniref:myo-inosose-2 dehydratase n=1 Tax=Alicyclobacillus macrosporangiidus TaxID=392015 RepID=UPI000497E187|nr:myo-inosose-2 dehydratase [Alicyclobacillus macrosporangiidus]
MYNVRLGVSPINWINDDMPDLGDAYDVETVWADMASLGFEGTEMGRKYPRDPEQLKPRLAKHGLVLTGAWTSVRFSTGVDEEQAFAAFQVHVQFLRRMGARYAVVCDQGGARLDGPGPRGAAQRYDDAAWARLAAGLHRAATYARRFDVQVVYHPHLGTAVETPDEIDRLMAMTDPELVGLLVDTGHIRAAGGEPERVIRKHAERVRYVHLKDVRQKVLAEAQASGASFLQAVRQGMFTTPGDGCVDFASVFDALRGIGYQGWMIVEAEQDPASAEPVSYARAAKAYITQLMAD